MTTKPVAKIALVKEWKTYKSIADKAMQQDVAKRKKEGKGDKDELLQIATDEKEWKALYKTFNMGLTPTLQALENAKTPEDQLKWCKDGIKICQQYHKVVMKHQVHLSGPPTGQNVKITTMSLSGGLNRITQKLQGRLKAH